MDGESTIQALKPNIWVIEFPMCFLGMALGRRVTICRLSEGKLAIHSTGPFSQKQVSTIEELGQPELLIEGTTMHDTFSREGQRAFPLLDYRVPEGFPKSRLGETARPLAELEERTRGEMNAVRLDGLRFLTEYACFHPASQTLVLCDLMLNLTNASGYTRWNMRYLMGVRQWPAIDRAVRLAIADRQAFHAALKRIDEWDFDTIIFAHGGTVFSGGKEVYRNAAARAGFAL